MSEKDPEMPYMRDVLKGHQQRIEALSREMGGTSGGKKPGSEKSAPSSGDTRTISDKLQHAIQLIDDDLNVLRSHVDASAPDVPPSEGKPSESSPQRPSGQDPVESVPVVGFWKIAALLLVGAGLLAGAWIKKNSGGSQRLPSGHTVSFVWQGESLWIADWFEPAIYLMKDTPEGLQSVDRFPLDDVHVMAIALTPTHIYLADPWTHRIERRRRDDALSLESSVPSPGPSPSALFFDGTYLWSADKEERKIYKHTLDEALSVRETYSVDHAPGGLFVDNARMWSSAADTGDLYKHDPATGKVLAVYSVSRGADGSPLAAFTWKGRSLFFARDGGQELIQLPWWKLDRVSGGDR